MTSPVNKTAPQGGSAIAALIDNTKAVTAVHPKNPSPANAPLTSRSQNIPEFIAPTSVSVLGVIETNTAEIFPRLVPPEDSSYTMNGEQIRPKKLNSGVASDFGRPPEGG